MSKDYVDMGCSENTPLAPFLVTFTFGLVGGDMEGHKQLFLTYIFLGLPWCSGGKVSACLQCGRPGFDAWIGKIPWRRKWQPTPVPLPGKSNRQSSPVGYSPWGHRELDTTEWIPSSWYIFLNTLLWIIILIWWLIKYSSLNNNLDLMAH